MPFLCVSDRVDNWGEDSLDGVGVDSFDDAHSGGLSSISDWYNLVTNGCEAQRQENDEVWLDGGRGVLVVCNRLDGVESPLPYVGILLVAELLLQRLDGPGKQVVSISALSKFLHSELLRPAVRHTIMKAPKLKNSFQIAVSVMLESFGENASKIYVYLLGRSIALFDRTVDESCQVESGSIDIFLGLADVQLGHQLVKDLDGVLVFVCHVGGCCL